MSKVLVSFRDPIATTATYMVADTYATSAGLLAEFRLAYNLGACVRDPEGVAASMNNSIAVLKTVEITDENSNKITADHTYIDKFTAKAVVEGEYGYYSLYM